MEIQRRVLKDGAVRWRVRWRLGGRYRSQTFDRKGDAVTFGAELRRRQQLGTLTEMDMGRVTLADYVVGNWARRWRSSGATSASRRSSSSARFRLARRRTQKPPRTEPSGSSSRSPPTSVSGGCGAAGPRKPR